MHHSLLALLCALALPASALTLTVDTDDDQLDVPAGANLSLREAIRDANSGDVIEFNSSLSYATIDLTLGELEITNTTLTIDGSSLSYDLTIDADRDSRIFDISSSTVNIHSLRLIRGSSTQQGGAVRLATNSVLTLNSCNLLDNYADQEGGAIYNSFSSLVLNDCQITHNSSPSNGGGIALLGAGASLESNESTIAFNRSDNQGGGIHADSVGSIALLTSALVNNLSTSSGGGAFVENGPLTLRNTTVSGNHAAKDGGGLHIADDLSLDSSTISKNTATGLGGGVRLSTTGTRTIRNTIVADNRAGSETDLSVGGGVITPSAANLIGTNNGCATAFPAGNPNGNNDLVGTDSSLLDPQLSALGFYGGKSESMHPLSGSPVIDAGGSTGLSTDQRGLPRVVSTIDIGSVETSQVLTVTTLVDENNVGLGMGAGDSLRECINAITSSGHIIFAQGLNNGTIPLAFIDIDVDAITAFVDASTLPNGITINGGSNTRAFSVTNQATLALHSVHIRDGQNLSSGGGIQCDGAWLTTIDCSFTDCKANSPGGVEVTGGAIALRTSPDRTTAVLVGTSLTNNSASGATNLNTSGAIATQDADLRCTRCDFEGNSASGPSSPAPAAGGAIGGGRSTVVIERSSFHNNQATGKSSGGALKAGGFTLLDRCTLTSNTANRNDPSDTADGGAISIVSAAPLYLRTCTFSGNSAEDDGGAIHLLGELFMVHCTLSHNTATNGVGGGIRLSGEGTLSNSIIAKNTAGTSSDDLYKALFSTFTNGGGNLIGSNGGVGTEFPSGPLVGTIATPLDPLLGPIADYGGPTETRILLATSPAIDAGISSIALRETDQRGLQRPLAAGPDIGAYETGHHLGYAIWAAEQIPSPLDASFTGDSEGDKNQNGIEYACGLTPTASDSTGILSAVLMPGGTEMHLTFPYEPDAPDLRYIIGRNNDLGAFNPRYGYNTATGNESFHVSGNVTSIVDPIGKTITVIDQATSTTHGHWQLGVEELF